MSELIVVAYHDEETAEQVLDTLTRLRTEQLIDLADVCYVTRSQDGKIKLHQAVNLMASGASSGALWGGLIGLLFLMPLAGMVVGAASGALIGTLSDYGINDGLIRDLSQQLQPGSSALFVLVRRATPDKVLEEVRGFGGTVLHTSLSNEEEARLEAALAAGRTAPAPTA